MDRGNLVGYSPWSHIESDTIQQLSVQDKFYKQASSGNTGLQLNSQCRGSYWMINAQLITRNPGGVVVQPERLRSSPKWKALCLVHSPTWEHTLISPDNQENDKSSSHPALEKQESGTNLLGGIEAMLGCWLAAFPPRLIPEESSLLPQADSSGTSCSWGLAEAKATSLCNYP